VAVAETSVSALLLLLLSAANSGMWEYNPGESMKNRTITMDLMINLYCFFTVCGIEEAIAIAHPSVVVYSIHPLM
jgi:hypothetical protein